MVQTFQATTTKFILRLFKDFEELSTASKLEKLMFFYFCTMMSAGAIVWGSICLIHGYALPALIPFGYVVTTFLNFMLCSQMTENKIGCTLQVITSISLPFLFQFALGGLISSGYVMVWSVLALLGTITFQSRKAMMGWVALFVALCSIAFFKEYTTFYNPENGLPIVLTALNLVSVSLIIFGLASYFIRMQREMALVNVQQRKEISQSKEMIETDLQLAKDFQDMLRSDLYKAEVFSDLLEINTCRSKVNGNFFWQGSFLHMRVLVYVENPHEGVKGSMEAMMLLNMIENAVSRLEMESPQQLISFIQRDLYSRYDLPQMRESINEIKLAVICYDTVMQELAVASTGVVIVLEKSKSLMPLVGFDNTNRKKQSAPNGDTIIVASHQVLSGDKLVFVNRPVLDTLSIADDQKLSARKNLLSSVFEWDFKIAEKELRKRLEDKGTDNDMFLMAVKL